VKTDDAKSGTYLDTLVPFALRSNSLARSFLVTTLRIDPAADDEVLTAQSANTRRICADSLLPRNCTTIHSKTDPFSLNNSLFGTFGGVRVLILFCILVPTSIDCIITFKPLRSVIRIKFQKQNQKRHALIFKFFRSAKISQVLQHPFLFMSDVDRNLGEQL
jgi:hypothetical protein